MADPIIPSTPPSPLAPAADNTSTISSPLPIDTVLTAPARPGQGKQVPPPGPPVLVTQTVPFAPGAPVAGAPTGTAGASGGAAAGLPAPASPSTPAAAGSPASGVVSGQTTTGSVTGTTDAQGNVVCPPGYVPGESLVTGSGAQDLSNQIHQLLASAPPGGGALASSSAGQPTLTISNAGPCIGTPVLHLDTPVTVNDILHLDLVSVGGSAVTVSVEYKLLRCDGKIVTGRLDMKVPASVNPTGEAQSACLTLTDGYLLSVSASTNGNPCLPGSLWLQAYLSLEECNPLGFEASSATKVLFADYAPVGNFIGWPGGRIQTPGDGPGADDGFNFLVGKWGVFPVYFGLFFGTDTGSSCRIKQVSAKLTTSADAGNRSLYLQLEPQTGPVVNFGSSTTQGPGTTRIWTWAHGIEPGLITPLNQINIPIPDNIQMTDQDELGILGLNMVNNADTVNYAGLVFKVWAGLWGNV